MVHVKFLANGSVYSVAKIIELVKKLNTMKTQLQAATRSLNS